MMQKSGDRRLTNRHFLRRQYGLELSQRDIRLLCHQLPDQVLVRRQSIPLVSAEFGRNDTARFAVEPTKADHRADTHTEALRNFRYRGALLRRPHNARTQILRIRLPHPILASFPARILNPIRVRMGIPPDSVFSGNALVVRPWLRFHIPLIEPDMQISRIRLSDKTSRLCFRVQRHLQFLNPSWSLYVAQSPRFFTTYCVCLELRPLPSAGITRFQRYYEPLRHPKAPGLSLAGLQLVIALTTPWGFPCCVRFPCVHAVATTPAQRLGVWFRSVTQPCQPSPKGSSGRPAHRPFRGLLGVHSRYGLHTRAVTNS